VGVAAEAESAGGSARRRILGLGLGALAALCAVLVRRALEGPPFEPGAPRFWVADRDGGRVVGLDQDLFVAREWCAPWPVALAARADGMLWVLSAVDGRPAGRHELLLLSADGERRAVTSFDGPARLALDERGKAVLLSSGSGARPIVRVDELGRPSVLAALEGALCIAVARGEVLVGDGSGRVHLIASEGGHRTESIGGRLVEAAADAGNGGWWLVDAAPPGRVLRLDSELAVVWVRELAGCARLVPLPAGGRVWVSDGRGDALLRLDDDGRTELELGPLPLAGVHAAVATTDGGLIARAPGALLRWDGEGRRRPGQAGFAFALDVARVPAAAFADPRRERRAGGR